MAVFFFIDFKSLLQLHLKRIFKCIYFLLKIKKSDTTLLVGSAVLILFFLNTLKTLEKYLILFIQFEPIKLSIDS